VRRLRRREPRWASGLHGLAEDPPTAADVVVTDTDVGTLALHASDQVITPMIRDTGVWEAAEATWLRGAIGAGDTVVDCGANVGYFSLLASRAVGPRGTVIAVEPDAGNLRLLRHNLWRNGCDNVRVIAAAAADERGVLALRHSETNFGDHQVHPDAAPDDVLVPCVALDEVLGGARVNVVKIDTQGFDHLVLAGLTRTLSANPAARVLVEFWTDGMAERQLSAEDILAQYRALGRPLALLGDAGAAIPASDEQVFTSVRASPGHWVNLILGARE
jgi:FkbM family methyltransferase